VVNLRPEDDHPGRVHEVADLSRVAAILQRVAADVDELARARRVADLGAAAAGPDRRAERRRRVAEPNLDVREFAHGADTAAGGAGPAAPTCSFRSARGSSTAGSPVTSTAGTPRHPGIRSPEARGVASPALSRSRDQPAEQRRG